MELKGKKAPKKAKKDKPSPAPKSTKKKVNTKGKKLRGTAEDDIDPQDETITVSSEIPEEVEVQEQQATEVSPVLAFEQGIVSPAMATAMNAHWGRTEETLVLMMAMKNAFMVNGVFIGDIVIKPSFVKRSKGSALL